VTSRVFFIMVIQLHSEEGEPPPMRTEMYRNSELVCRPALGWPGSTKTHQTNRQRADHRSFRLPVPVFSNLI